MAGRDPWGCITSITSHMRGNTVSTVTTVLIGVERRGYDDGAGARRSIKPSDGKVVARYFSLQVDSTLFFVGDVVEV